MIGLFIFISQFAFAENCQSLAEKAETSLSEPAARAAIEACAREKVKTARPYLVMAVLANREQRFDDVIKWGEKAVLQEPGLAIAHLDICSAYMQLKKYDQAAKACKKSRKLDPALAQTDFYLGTIEEIAKKNLKAAAIYFEFACRLGSPPACESLARVKGPPDPATPDEEKLWSAFEESYRKKGLDANLAKSNVSAIRKGMAHMKSAERVHALQGMLNQVQ